MLIRDLPHANFSAKWSSPINHLNPAAYSLARRVSDFVKSVVFLVPNFFLEKITRSLIYPASSYFFKKQISNHAIQEFKSIDSPMATHSVSIKTPDGVELKGHFFQHRNHDHPNSRVVILFHGNGDFYQSGSWFNISQTLFELDEPISYFVFNPRGIGESSGCPNVSKLLIDAETAYQYVKDGLGVSENRIDMYGHSLGGAQAAQLKALHPNTGGKLILDRTFSNLNIESEHFLSMLGFNSSLLKKIAHYFIKTYDWNFKSDQAIKHIKDPVYIFTHEQDRIIPPACNIVKTVESWDIKPDNFHVYSFNDPYGNAHTKPLRDLVRFARTPALNTHTGWYDFSDAGKSGADFLKRAFNPHWEVEKIGEVFAF